MSTVTERIERVIGETHNYARQTFQSLITWFVIFATVNYATMGWLAKDVSSFAKIGVSMLFLSQNVIGIAAVVVVSMWFRKLQHRIRTLEVVRDREDGLVSDDMRTMESETMPCRFYRSVCAMMAVALLILAAAWAILSAHGSS